jgi:hypothetical protein
VDGGEGKVARPENTMLFLATRSWPLATFKKPDFPAFLLLQICFII